MTPDLVVVLVLLAAAIVMFALNKPRMDAVALIMLTILPFTGVISMGEALACFSDAYIVLLVAMVSILMVPWLLPAVLERHRSRA